MIDDELDHKSVAHAKGQYKLTLCTKTIAGVTVDELCRAFEDLLLGHGYRLKGEIEVVEEEINDVD